MGKLNKKGVSQVITAVLVIFIIIMAIVLVWMILTGFLEKQGEITQAKAKFFTERIEINNVVFDQANPLRLELDIRKHTGKSVLVDIETEEAIRSEADIISVVDLSRSMICSDSFFGTFCSCYGVTEQCCTDTLGSTNYEPDGGKCYDISYYSTTECVDICGGRVFDKLMATQDASKNLTESLITDEDDNQIGFVTYNEEVVEEGCSDLTREIPLLNSKIDSWTPLAWGYTCICCGINKAASDLTEQSPLADKIKAMIVMSDGQANIACVSGQAEQDAIIAACEANATIANLTIYSIGIGSGVDQDTLTSIAECGDGEYFHVDQIDDLTQIYETIAGKIIETYETVHQINYLLIVFYDEVGNSHREIITELPEVLEIKKYDFNLDGQLDDIHKIEIIPVIVTSSGKEVFGPVLDVWEAG